MSSGPCRLLRHSLDNLEMVTSSSVSRKPQLDALRAVAVMAVMVEHFSSDGFFTARVLNLGLFGLLGVLLFFVLSGYLITGILLSLRESSLRRALERFYIRRTLRIFPIYYLTLLVLMIIGLPSVTQYILWHGMYLSNVLFVLKPQVAAPIAHLWTLSVEEQFYLIWPWLMLAVPYKHVHRVILCAITIGICWKAVVINTLGDHLAAALPVFSCLDSLAVGAWLAFVEQDETLRSRRQHILRTWLFAGSAIVLMQTVLLITDGGRGLVVLTSYIGASLFFAWLVGRAAQGFKGWVGAVLEWRLMLYMGKISYGIYLYHYFMPRVLTYLLKNFGFDQPGSLFAGMLAFALTVLTATLSWYLLERPISHLKERLSYPV